MILRTKENENKRDRINSIQDQRPSIVPSPISAFFSTHNITIMATGGDDDVAKKGKASPGHATPTKKYRRRKPVPHLSELLAYGPEETRGQPKTWKELLIFPMVLSVLFFLSFLLFMKVFPHLSHNRSFSLPKRNQMVPAVTPPLDGITPNEEPPLEPKEEKIDTNLAEF